MSYAKVYVQSWYWVGTVAGQNPGFLCPPKPNKKYGEFGGDRKVALILNQWRGQHSRLMPQKLCPPSHEEVKVIHSVLSSSLQPHGLKPTRLPSVHGIQARILEWVAISFSRGSSRRKDSAWSTNIINFSEYRNIYLNIDLFSEYRFYSFLSIGLF